MRKSDDHIEPKKAVVEHIQTTFKADRFILYLILVSGICRFLFASRALLLGLQYFFPHEASDEEILVHTFLYDYNYSPFVNLVFALILVGAPLLLLKRNKWGYRIYLISHLVLILGALSHLSESQMNRQSYYWILSGVWVILLTWRKGYMK